MYLGEHQGAVAYIVHFFDGARTFVHSHEIGQILIILRGTAQIGTVADGVVEELNAGDVMYAPAGELHWHGAAPGSNMTNLSVTFGASVWHGPPPERTT
jgi:quercetin dioxygenase-like cupin family protein